MTNLDSVLKSKDITFLTKVRLVQAIFFSSSHVWMWELDHKQAWVPRNWWFWTVVLEKSLESPVDCKETNQSILKEINPKYSLEGLLLKLKNQYFGHLMWGVDKLEKLWCWESWKAKSEGGSRGLDGYTPSPPQWTWIWANSRILWRREDPGMLQSMGSQESDMTLWLRINTIIIVKVYPYCSIYVNCNFLWDLCQINSFISNIQWRWSCDTFYRSKILRPRGILNWTRLDESITITIAKAGV